MNCRSRPALLRLNRIPIQVGRYASNSAGRGRSGNVAVTWILEKIRACEKYPISVALKEKDWSQYRIASKFKVPADPIYSNKRTAHARSQIVSPDLCDDVLKYIGPSLEKHKGCDILDFNPGVGLWSQKLHEFLQPRSHILVEQSPELYAEYLTPLLEKAGSKYKLLPAGPLGQFETYDQLMQEGVLPHQTPLDPQDPARQQPNDTLLVTGSLMWDPKLPGMAFDSMVRQILQKFAEVSRSNDWFHAHGLVRSLLWMADDDFKGCIPRSQSKRNKFDFVLDILGNYTEVVTPGHVQRHQGKTSISREPQWEIESIMQAMRRGRENGMELPVHRRENVHDFAEDIEKLTNGTGDLSPIEIHRYFREQELAGKSTVGVNMDSYIRSYHVDRAMEENPERFKERNPKTGKLIRTEASKEAARNRASTKRFRSLREHVYKVAAIGVDVYHLECKVLRMEDGPEKEAVIRQLQSREEDFEVGLRNTALIYKSAVLTEIDDRLSLHSPVTRLQWDSRPYEPLVMQPEEIWPANRVSLVDFVPRPCPPGQSPEDLPWLQDFAIGLFETPSNSVYHALENLQHGASDLIEQAPSLRDPSKGGRLNMKQLRVRMLTVEMMTELCQAFREWPFKNPSANHSRYFGLKAGKQGN